MSAPQADIVRRSKMPASRWQRHQRLARRTTALAALTPDAPSYASYPGTSEPQANCYAYANGCRVSHPYPGVSRPGGGQSPPDTPEELVANLLADGWKPGIPEQETSGVLIALAFWRNENLQAWISRDYHFVRLGPDGWSHKAGTYPSGMVADPFTAVSSGQVPYTVFCGWWTVPLTEESNQVRRRFIREETAHQAYWSALDDSHHNELLFA